MNVGKWRRGGIFLCALLLLSPGGCGGRKAAMRGEPPLPAATGPKVAVAPLENRSNDISASEIIRSAFISEIGQRGWNVVPPEESDRVMRETLGISYGGQLASTTPETVCRELGVDGVFYGEVQEWNKTTTGVYNKVTVTASFELYAKDGTRLWEGSDTQSKVAVPRGGQQIGTEIAVYALGNLLLTPMTPYGKAVARNIARKVPAGLLDGSGTGNDRNGATRGTGTPAEGGGNR